MANKLNHYFEIWFEYFLFHSSVKSEDTLLPEVYHCYK